MMAFSDYRYCSQDITFISCRAIRRLARCGHLIGDQKVLPTWRSILLKDWTIVPLRHAPFALFRSMFDSNEIGMMS